MRFELQFKVYGDINIINNHIEIVNQPYLIKLFKESNQFYISISKRIEAGSNCLPILTNVLRQMKVFFQKNLPTVR